jgi:hypothetical protein
LSPAVRINLVEPRTQTPSPARLYALLAGAILTLLGVLGFFYESSFGHGQEMVSDDIRGTLQVNGWEDLLWVVTGLVGLAVASRAARAYALAVGVAYTVFGIWALSTVDRGFGTIADVLPLSGWNTAMYLLLGLTGIAAGIASGPLPGIPARARRVGRRRERPQRREPGSRAQDSR